MHKRKHPTLPLCLNIGCGRLQKSSDENVEWVNIDKAEEVHSDITMDMSKEPLPFPEGSVTRIEAIACLGQIESNTDFLFVMNELHRVLKAGGVLYVLLPHKDYEHAWMDPFNQRKFNELTLLGFDKEHAQWVNHNSYYGFLPWQNVEVNVRNGFLISTLIVCKDATP
jgi:SAM-dependent methyltransferase